MIRHGFLFALTCVLLALCCYNLFGQTECKSYCEEAVKAVQETDRTVCGKASEIVRTCMMLEARGVEGVDVIGQKVTDTRDAYMEAKKLVGVGMYIFDMAGAFEAAGVEVQGFNYETAARIVTAGKSKLDALEAALDKLAEELRAIIDEPNKAA